MGNDLGEKIKRHRIKYGLTQAQMAKKCGLSVPTIISIEADAKYHRPNFMTIGKIEKVLMEGNENETE